LDNLFTGINNNTLRGEESNYEDERTIGGSRKAPALPLPTPEGSHPQQLARYRSQVLAYVNAASVHQLQKLATVGTKAAQSIVNFRNVSGRYGDLDALQNVPGLRKNFFSNFLKVSIFFKCEIRDFLNKFSFVCTAGQSSGLLISHRLGKKCKPRNF
jgi:Helix-hairpin-helix motif